MIFQSRKLKRAHLLVIANQRLFEAFSDAPPIKARLITPKHIREREDSCAIRKSAVSSRAIPLGIDSLCVSSFFSLIQAFEILKGTRRGENCLINGFPQLLTVKVEIQTASRMSENCFSRLHMLSGGITRGARGRMHAITDDNWFNEG